MQEEELCKNLAKQSVHTVHSVASYSKRFKSLKWTQVQTYSISLICCCDCKYSTYTICFLKHPYESNIFNMKRKTNNAQLRIRCGIIFSSPKTLRALKAGY